MIRWVLKDRILVTQLLVREYVVLDMIYGSNKNSKKFAVVLTGGGNVEF